VLTLSEAAQRNRAPPGRGMVVTALGLAQILAWGSSFYFPAVFASPIVAETGWSLGFVVGGVSLGLLVAGLVSPQVGRVVERRGGRPVLLTSSLCYIAGLTGIALAPSLTVYLGAWVILGVGMGTGLYDAVFATLGRLYGLGARHAITNLTLFGGFSSTVCWPLSAAMIDGLGWRGACLAYAALHLCFAMPLQMFATRGAVAGPPAVATSEVGEGAPLPDETVILALLMGILCIASALGAIFVVYLFIFLEARGVGSAAAIWLGTLFGPSQVAARIVERLFGSGYHPIWTMVGSCGLMAAGLILLSAGASLPVIIILLFGAGFGISLVARGTLPLALFGPQRFPRLMGRIAFPSLMVQAVAPSLGALLIDSIGTDATIGTLLLLAIVNLILIAALLSMWRKTIREH